MGNSPDRDADREWLEQALLDEIKCGPERFDYWALHGKAIAQKLPKAARAGVTQRALLETFCGTPGDPTCRIEDAPPRFANKKAKFRRIMVLAALRRLELGCRIEKVEGAEIRRRAARPARFEAAPAYRIIGIMDALAIASSDGEPGESPSG